MNRPLNILFALTLGCAATAPGDRTPQARRSGATGTTASSSPSGSPSARVGTDASEQDSSSSVAANAKGPVAGPFSESRVQDIVRANFEKMGDCYQLGLRRDPKLKGTINVSITVDGEGRVVRATAPKSDKPKPKRKKRKRRYWEKKPKDQEELITDTEVVSCIEGEFKVLRFPPTGRGLVTLVYPIVLRTE